MIQLLLQYLFLLLDLHGKLPVKSVYAVHSSSLSMIMYATSLVFVFGVDDLGKQSSSISAHNKSSNDCPGAFFAFNLLKWRLMSVIDAFLFSLVFVLCRFCPY